LIEPATFSAAALSGDLTSANRFSMMPAPLGQLDLLAAGTLRLGDGATSDVRPDIFMMDNNPDLMSNPGAPRLFSQADINVLNGTVSKTTPQIAFHTLGGLHAADAQPVRLIALNGDIVGDRNNAATISLPNYAEILAGRDIVDLGFTIQQNNASDVTTIVAGRDFIETSTPSPGLPYDDNLQMKNIVTGPAASISAPAAMSISATAAASSRAATWIILTCLKAAPASTSWQARSRTIRAW
jgi:hypothetical protein